MQYYCMLYLPLLVLDTHATFQCVDANQRWDVQESIDWMVHLAEYKPLWIEEPTSPDDVLGHAAIAEVRLYLSKYQMKTICHQLWEQETQMTMKWKKALQITSLVYIAFMNRCVSVVGVSNSRPESCEFESCP